MYRSFFTVHDFDDSFCHPVDSLQLSLFGQGRYLHLALALTSKGFGVDGSRIGPVLFALHICSTCSKNLTKLTKVYFLQILFWFCLVMCVISTGVQRRVIYKRSATVSSQTLLPSLFSSCSFVSMTTISTSFSMIIWRKWITVKGGDLERRWHGTGSESHGIDLRREKKIVLCFFQDHINACTHHTYN